MGGGLVLNADPMIGLINFEYEIADYKNFMVL